MIQIPENRLADLASALYVQADGSKTAYDCIDEAEKFLAKVAAHLAKKASEQPYPQVDFSMPGEATVGEGPKVNSAEYMNGPQFTVDAQGRKHYTMDAECGQLGLDGKDIG